MKSVSLLVFFSVILGNTFAQLPFTLALEPVVITNLPAVQSFAACSEGDKILLLGGRRDGLHRRQPFASFDALNNNTSIILVDMANQSFIERPLAELSVALQEQLQSSNMQYAKYGDYFIVTGGYGRSNTAQDHITYPRITAIHVPTLISALENQSPIGSAFITKSMEEFAVTGGQMRVLNDTFLLVGGHRFDGRYNPNNGPSFTQTYTNAVTRFTIEINSGQISIPYIQSTADNQSFHRRDYNLVGSVINNQLAYTVTSGVFREDADLPYENWVDVDLSGHQIIPSFQQKLAHYHSAHTELFDANTSSMYYLFYGGMARYYYNNQNQLIQNDSVPFVKTISCVERTASGLLTEHRMNMDMPVLTGSGAEFFNLHNEEFDNAVLKMAAFTSDTVTLGYILGGITSSAPNIFWINTGTESSANSIIYKVKLIRSNTVGINQIEPDFQIHVSPNPTNGLTRVLFPNLHSGAIQIRLVDANGRQVEQKELTGSSVELLMYEMDMGSYAKGTYYITISQGQKTNTVRLIK